MGEERRFSSKGAVLEVDRETEQALLNRYNLVKERRNLRAKTAEVEETLNGLLKEVFAARFTVGPETAEAFEELTARLAKVAAEYREVLVIRARVEEQLGTLAWLKAELEM